MASTEKLSALADLGAAPAGGDSIPVLHSGANNLVTVTELLSIIVPASPVAFTQTYSTVGTTVPAATYAAPAQTAAAEVLSATAIAAKTPSATLIDVRTDTLAHACDDITQDLMDLGTTDNALRTDIIATNAKLALLAADVIVLKNLIGTLIDILQAATLAA